MLNRYTIFVVTLLLGAFQFSASAQLASDSIKNASSFVLYSNGGIGKIKTASDHKSLGFAGGLWLNALDTQYRDCYAANFYDGSEVPSLGHFTPGPISSNPNAAALYNHVWKVERTVIDSFIAGNYGANIPSQILDWPAHGNPAFGESLYLAPFVDTDNNGTYNPYNGDYPCFPGDEALFFVCNDDATPTLSNPRRPLGVEITGMAYLYKASSFLDSVIYLNYSITSKKMLLQKFQVGLFHDFDLGFALDDLVGTFIDQNTMIAYNADGDDEGPLGFGIHPPSTGITVLSGIRADAADGVDNNRDGCIDGIRDSLGNCMPEDYGNNILEYWMLNKTMYYNNTQSIISGNPNGPLEFKRYLNAVWRDGRPLVIESPSGFLNTNNGDGYSTDSSTIPISFAFPGNTFDTSGIAYPNNPTNWFDSPVNQSDIRMVGELGKKQYFVINNTLQLKLAIFMARDSNTINSYDAAHAMAVKINGFVDVVPNCSGSRLISVEEEKTLENLELFPNPTQNWLSISAPNEKAKQGAVLSYDGRIVLQFQLDEVGAKALDVSALPAGFYVLRIENQSKRFIISR